MSAKIKITTKIYLGFAVAVLICVGLGAYGIWNFTDIRRETYILTNEYVPEVSVLSRLERNASKTMYNLRGYSFTGNERFLEQGLESFEGAQVQVKDAHELIAKSPHLKALASTMDSIEANLKKYKGLIDDTKGNQKSMAGNREVLNAAATDVIKNADEFLESQFENAVKEIASGASKDKVQERLDKINQAVSIVNLINSTRIAAWRSQYLDDSDGLQKIQPNFAEVLLKLKNLRATTRLDLNLRQLDAIEAGTRKYGLAVEDTIRGMQKLSEINSKRNEVGEDILEVIENTTRAGMDGTIKIAESAGRIVNNSVMMFSIGLVIAVVVSGFLAFMIASGIGRALRGIIEKLKDSSQQVTESANQLSSAAQQLSGASNEQASSIEETSSSLEEISGMIENNVGNAEQSFKLSSEVMGVSESANESMRKLEISIKEILASNDKIEQLVKVIGNIGEKTKVMDEIVFQTKLLSFNASVEAERAGEHGRGFAVVAQEVGNLAQMSGKSAQEIAEIVKSSIHEAEAITNENRKKVDQGNQYVGESAKGLKMIMEAAKTVSSGSNQVLQASKDQAAGIKQVSSAMTELDNATQQNAATAEETAASSEELSAQAEVLNSIVGDLYVLVEGQSALTTEAVHSRSVDKPVGRTQGKVVQLAQRKKPHRPQAPLQKRAVGSDIDPAGNNGRSDEAWEKL